ncbi:hypothetical protein H8S90_16460 [Olivibacter sp. SDN3]|uniref:hypothetical protein n=1 Tax=Olivibacter sp. SDN3 TaxID=2764720 RepID=UPI001650FD5E|nr:hypothetical protein [Olivibacter sp. SDN3]QNL48378.1 hypothetical protein H8S90_16460 [Olivibacter sp. SDN3]
MKKITGLFILLGLFAISSCGQSTSENDEESDYRDTVESSTPLNDNNMRNDQPTEELTKKDSLGQDSI